MPLLTIARGIKKNSTALTADVVLLLVDFVDLRVHVYVHGSIFQQPFSPLLELLVDPVSEFLTGDVVNDVRYILPMEHVDLPGFFWQNLKDFWILLGELEHLLNGEAVEVRHMHLTDILALDGLALALDDATEMVNAHSLRRVTVNAAMKTDESEAFVLRTVLL